VEEKRAAFEASIRKVSSKLEQGADSVQHAVDKVKHVAAEGRGMVERNPWVFIAAAVGVGVAIGATGGRRRVRLELPAFAGGETVTHPVKRPSLLWGVAAFVTKSLLRTVTGAALISVERLVQEKLGVSPHDRER